MEEETFSNSEVAEVMNSNFINIKVDREERPDVDELYMKSLVLMTGSGGWPMNIIALPDGSPIWGGTYLPKTNWMSVLVQIDELFKKRFNDVQDYANKLKKGLQQENMIQVKLEEEIFEIVKDLNQKEGVSFLLAEQNTNIALKYATYGYILENGRVVMDGTAEDLKNNEDVKEFYLGVGAEGRASFRDVKHYRRRKRWLG